MHGEGIAAEQGLCSGIVVVGLAPVAFACLYRHSEPLCLEIVVVGRTYLLHSPGLTVADTEGVEFAPTAALGEVVGHESQSATRNLRVVSDDAATHLCGLLRPVDVLFHRPSHVLKGHLHGGHHVLDLQTLHAKFTLGPLLHLLADAFARIEILHHAHQFHQGGSHDDNEQTRTCLHRLNDAFPPFLLHARKPSLQIDGERAADGEVVHVLLYAVHLGIGLSAHEVVDGSHVAADVF